MLADPCGVVLGGGMKLAWSPCGVRRLAFGSKKGEQRCQGI